MKTGEGKTLVATLPAALNALTGRGVHVVTVNDYLARRDSEWMGQVHRRLGLSVGCVVTGMNDAERRAAYACDVIYGQNNEFGFDYLRDNMKPSFDDVRAGRARLRDRRRGRFDPDRRGAHPADHLRSGRRRSREVPDDRPADPAPGRRGALQASTRRRAAPRSPRTASVAVERLLGVENLYAPHQMETLHVVQSALRAHALYKRDVDYVVKDGEVIIVDEHTGRLMVGPALERRPAPGGRGQGRRAHPERDPDLRDDHLPELLPHVREAGGHDRHRRHRGQRVRPDLRPRRGRDPDAPADGPPRPATTWSTAASARSGSR